MPSPMPTHVEPSGTQAIRFAWSDGSRSEMPYAALRFECPCASCVDEHTGRRVIQRESIPADIRVTGVQPVGRYALQFSWSDGHVTGIYHFDRLYEICKAFASTVTA